jgi:hypothetical protein
VIPIIKKEERNMLEQHTRRRGNLNKLRKSVAVAGVVAVGSVVGLFGASTASALPPQMSTFSFSEGGVIDCGTFVDPYTDFLTGTRTLFFDSEGNLVRVVFQVEHHSNDSNSVTGLVLHEHGHYTLTVDLLAGTVTQAGNDAIITRPGTGVVVQNVGRLVFDFDNNLLFFAGARQHNEFLEGEQLLCEALG